MMIAFLTVAALALVSMAGVALAKNVDADPAPVDSYVNGMLTVSANTADTFGVWAEYRKTTTVTFKDDAKYSKTMYFGKYTPAAAADEVAGTPAVLESLEAYVVIEFKDTKGIALAYEQNSDTVTIFKDNLGATDIKVTKGSVYVHSDNFNNFNGKIAGNTATMTLENVVEFELTAGETDVISGHMQKGTVVDVTSDTKYTAKLEGKAIVNNFLTVNDIEFTVAEGAEMTIESKGDMYAIDTGTAFTIDIGNTAAGTKFATSRIYDSYGDSVTYQGSFGNNKLSFTTSDLIYASPDVVYTLMVVYYDGTDAYVYAGDLTFSATFDTLNAIDGFKVNLSDSKTYSKFMKADFITSANNNIAFDEDRYDCLSATAIGGSSAKIGDFLTTPGIIAFNDVNALVNNDKVLVTFFDKMYGRYAVYQGTAGTAVLSECINTKILAVGAAAAAGTIVTGCKTDTTSGLTHVNRIVGLYVYESTINVDGDIKVVYKNEHTYSQIFNESTINVAGKIAYETVAGVAPLDCVKTDDVEPVINAAHYMVKEGTAAPYKYTNYYTTLAKAMAAAKDIDIFGEMVILDDTTLTGTPVGTATAKNKFTVMANSVFQIGRGASGSGTAAVEAKTAIVTLPLTSDMTMPTVAVANNNVAGYVDVVNGQFKVAGDTGSTAPKYTVDKVKALVFMKTTDYGIYTDIATALDLSVSGDTVKVRTASTSDAPHAILRNAEVKAGVTLTGNTGIEVKLVVKAGVTLTVSGTVDVYSIEVERKTSEKANGVLLLKSINVKATSAATAAPNPEDRGLNLLGTVEFASEFDNTAAAADTKFVLKQFKVGGDNATVKVIGKVKFQAITGTGTMLFDITGTANFNYAITSVFVNMNIAGGTVNKGESAIFNIFELTATGAAKIILGTSATPFKILEKAVIGTKSDAFADNANLAEMKLILDGESDANAYAIIYGKFTAEKIKISSSETGVTPAKTEFFLVSVNGNNPYLYQTVFAALAYDSEETYNYAMAMPFPEIVGHNFLGWYTNVQFSGNPFDSAKCGQQPTFYGKFALKTYVLTFEYQEGVKWLLDGIVVEGQKTTTYGNHNVKVAAAAGFDISKVTLKKGGAAYIAGESFPVAGDIVFSASEAAEKPAKADSFGLIETLLIIITIMVVIMAIIIALKLMRS